MKKIYIAGSFYELNCLRIRLEILLKIENLFFYFQSNIITRICV